MTTPETLPLSQECLKGLAEKIALFFAPHQDEIPSAEKYRRISPVIAENLQIEINVVDKSNSSSQKTPSVNEKCLTEITEQMNEFLDKHSIPQDTIAAFPSQQCLNELADLMSDFFIHNQIPPEIVDTLEVEIKYQSATDQEIMALTMGCVPGGPPHAPCSAPQKWGIK